MLELSGGINCTPAMESTNHKHRSTTCAACLEASIYKDEHQAKKREYSKSYYQIHKDEIILKKALERIAKGSKTSRRTRQRLYEAQAALPWIRSY
jgi:hypothetical protein